MGEIIEVKGLIKEEIGGGRRRRNEEEEEVG